MFFVVFLFEYVTLQPVYFVFDADRTRPAERSTRCTPLVPHSVHFPIHALRLVFVIIFILVYVSSLDLDYAVYLG